MFYGKCIAEEDIPYFSLLGNLLAKVDTKTYDYKELSNEILINTGDMYFRNNVYGNDKDENKYYPFLEVRTKVMDDKIYKSMEIMADIVKKLFI